MRSRRHSTDDAEVHIDMTPMLDFVLNLLIFFIVTSAYVKITGVDVSVPNAETATEEKGGNIFIGITAEGKVWIDKREVDIHSIRAHVARLKAETPDAAAVIQSDSAANTGTLVAVMDQVRMAGIEKIAVAANQTSASANSASK